MQDHYCTNNRGYRCDDRGRGVAVNCEFNFYRSHCVWRITCLYLVAGAAFGRGILHVVEGRPGLQGKLSRDVYDCWLYLDSNE